MRKFTYLVVVLMITFSLSAQKHATEGSLQAGPTVDQQSASVQTPKAVTGILNYDNGVVKNGLGNAGAHTIEPYHHFPAEAISQYVGKKITHFRIGMDDPSGYTVIKLRIKLDSVTAEPVVDETMDVADLIAGGIALFELANAYTIPAGKDIFIGLFLDSGGGYGIAVDTDGSNYPENSGIMFWNGALQASSIGTLGYGDFIIQGIITDDGEMSPIKDLSIVGASAVSEGCELSATESIKVELFNGGEESINELFNLTVEVDGVSVTKQVSPTGFFAGATIYAEVADFDMNAIGIYDVEVTHAFDDQVTHNNEWTGTINSGNGTITVDLTTDQYSGETAWTVYDLDGNVVAVNGPLAANTQTVTNVCVDASGCYTWVITDSYGDGISPDGTFTISFNGVVMGECPDGGNFGTEFKVMGLGDGCPDYDIAITDILLPAQVAPGDVDIKGRVKNNGVEELTSFDVVYKIGDFTSETYAVTGIAVATGDTYDFTHDAAYNFDTDGTYTIEVTVSNPSGEADENPADNVKTQVVVVVEGILDRKQLFEHFTSSTCAPCASYTPTVDALLTANPDKYSLIRYQVSWPSPGDPYTTQQAADRVTYYGVSGVPSVYRNGEYNMDVTQDVFDAYAAVKTIVSLNVEATYEGDEVSVVVNVGAIADLDAGKKLHVVIVENKTTGNTGNNGETEFFNVMMQMLPSSSGTTLDSIAADGSVEITLSYDMSTTFVEEMNDLTVVVFVQDDAAKEILQSEMVSILIDDIDESATASFNVYPNPFNNTLTIDNLDNASQIIVSNVLGQTVMTVNVNSNTMDINTADLNKGVYLITIIDNNNNTRTERVVKQ